MRCYLWQVLSVILDLMNIYFSGIGGVGIGPLAEIAHDAGYHVVGSDLEDSLMTRQLRQKDINISIGQDGTFLQARHHDRPIDWFVYTSALPDNHPELLMARRLGIHIAKRDELLSFIINDKNLKLVGIAGTHGKTTTTGMLVWALQQLGIPISYSVGTTLKFGPSGKFDPKSEYFVYECDEFDRNFLHFAPYMALISTIDYDHPDTYPTQQSYLDAFRQFAINSVKVIAWDDQHSEIFKDLSQVTILPVSDINSSLKLVGEHNRRNATLVQAALKQLGFSQTTDDIINNFPGTDRRFEKLADNLYSDYGHHPTEIAATLQMASELSKHVVLVYQPHQNMRQYEIRDQYKDQFEKAEVIYWLPTYLSAGKRENSALPVLKPSDLIQNITNKDHVIIADFNEELWSTIQNERSKGNLVLFMGAGTIDSWLRDKLAKEQAKTTE
jgi:UDP-N-acetylmuramate--alanine ligase